MKLFKTFIAVALSILIPVESVSALPLGATPSASLFSISIPQTLGYVSETYSPSEPAAPRPDVILIQDLHVNRTVQFAISGILKQLKKQGLVPDRIGVEGETGPVNIAPMQSYPNAKIRKQASDYLVQQGEMPGPMHFAVNDGGVNLYGIETPEYYEANLDMFRRAYQGRGPLLNEISQIQTVLPALMNDPASRKTASSMRTNLEAASQLLNNQVIPEELLVILGRASMASEQLKQVLPQAKVNDMTGTLSASINFYTLALLRNGEMFKNAQTVRQNGQQKTSIIVTGGFHTEAIAKLCKAQGLSYAVITPNVRRHEKIDENLYIARLLGQHLTPEQAATGRDWAAMQMIQVANRALALFPKVTSSLSGKNSIRNGVAAVAAAVTLGPASQPVDPAVQSPAAVAAEQVSRAAAELHNAQGTVARTSARVAVAKAEKARKASDERGFGTAGMLVAAAAAVGLALTGAHLVLTGHAAPLLGFGAYSAIVAALVGIVAAMAIGLKQERDAQRTTLTRVRASINRVGQAVQATPAVVSAALKGLAAPAVAKIKDIKVQRDAAKENERLNQAAKDAAFGTAA